MRARTLMGLVAGAALLAAGCDHLCGCRKPARLYRDHRELPDVLKNEGPPPVLQPKNPGTTASANGGGNTGAYGGG
ncbi:MAG: hypothetical protein FJ304_13155 [Planctomycetes bacterium]|nr:hypothetical protein [Planctomycetota bacterium]